MTKLLKFISSYVKNLELLHKEQTRSLIKFKKLTKKRKNIERYCKKEDSILRNRIFKFDNIIKSRRYIVERTKEN